MKIEKELKNIKYQAGRRYLKELVKRGNERLKQIEDEEKHKTNSEEPRNDNSGDSQRT